MEKIFNHKSFNYFVWTPLESRVNKFAASVVDTDSKLPPVLLTCEYLCEFSKKLQTVRMGYCGAGEKLIHEKTRSKNLVTLSFKINRFTRPLQFYSWFNSSLFTTVIL
jgi:hypothetical protein